MTELELLSSRLKGLLLKRPGLTACLYGPAGIGKTFAVRQLLYETPCQKLELHAGTPPAQLLQALPRPKKPAVWVERGLEKLGAGEFIETAAITDVLGAILAGLAPFVLHLEDVHEVAPEQLESIQTFGQVVRRLKGVGLIVTSRTELLEPFENVQLHPLSSEEVKQILEREAGTTLPPECLEWIQSRAAGNPLYTLEFFRFLARQGFVWNDGRRWYWRTPDREVMPVTVEALIEQQLRYAASTPALEDAVRAKAMLPVGANQNLWETLSGLTPEVIRNARIELEHRNILVAGEFAHPLYREVTRQNLSVEQRRAFARRAIEILQDDYPEEAAGFVTDAQLAPERSVELLMRVAEQSNTPGRWLALAVEFLSGTERGRLALEAARQLTQSDLRLAEKLYRVALEINASEAVMLEFIAFLAVRQPDEAQALFEPLPINVRSSERGLAVHFDLMTIFGDMMGVIRFWQDDLGSSIDLDPDVLVHVIYALKSMARFDDAIQLADHVLARSDLSPWQRARVLNRQSTAYSESARYIQSLALTNQIIELLERHKLGGRDVILLDRALQRKNLGDYQAAIHDLKQALPLSLELGRTQNEMLIHSFLGSMLCEVGDYAQAEEFILEALEYYIHRPSSIYLCDTLNSLIELYIAWSDRPSSGLLAQKYAQLSLKHADALKMPAYLAGSRSHAGFAELEYRSPIRALELAQEAMAFQVLGDEFWGRWFPTWLEAKARCKLGEHAQALALLEQTVPAFERIGRVFEANLAGLDLDRLRNDLQSARGRLAWFRERGLINAVHHGLRLFPEFATETSSPILETRNELHVQVLGTMQIWFEGKPETVRGRKRQELLALLLEARIAGRAEASKLELLDAFYPDSDEVQATNTLQETVRAVRSSLSAEVIQTTHNGYALGSITSDAEVFLKSGNTNLWRGAYLNGLALETRDDTVRESVHQALFSAATDRLETDPQEATRVGRILLDFDPYNLDFLGLCVRALRATSNHKSLTRLYADARNRLFEVGEVIPERWQDFLERTPLRA